MRPIFTFFVGSALALSATAQIAQADVELKDGTVLSAEPYFIVT